MRLGGVLLPSAGELGVGHYGRLHDTRHPYATALRSSLQSSNLALIRVGSCSIIGQGSVHEDRQQAPKSHSLPAMLGRSPK